MSAHIVATHGGSPKRAREDRVRRKLARMGYQLMKSAARDPDNITFGGYMIIESLSSFAVAGHGGNARGGYGLDLDDVEAWVREYGHRRPRGAEEWGGERMHQYDHHPPRVLHRATRPR